MKLLLPCRFIQVCLVLGCFAARAEIDVGLFEGALLSMERDFRLLLLEEKALVGHVASNEIIVIVGRGPRPGPRHIIKIQAPEELRSVVQRTKYNMLKKWTGNYGVNVIVITKRAILNGREVYAENILLSAGDIILTEAVE